MADLTSNILCNISDICYCAGLRCCALGACVEGGNLFAKRGRVAWIVAPATSEVSRCWGCRCDAATMAQCCSGIMPIYNDWFIPNRSELICGFDCKSFWNGAKCKYYWSNNSAGCNPPFNQKSWIVSFVYKINPTDGIQGGTICHSYRSTVNCVRAFRKVFY